MRITVSNSKQSFVKPVALSEHAQTEKEFIRVWESYPQGTDMEAAEVLVSNEAVKAIRESDNIPVSTLRTIGGGHIDALNALLRINPIDNQQIWADCEALRTAEKWCTSSSDYIATGEQAVVTDLHNWISDPLMLLRGTYGCVSFD